MPELVRRQEALAATLARFDGKEFELGKADCVKLIAFHLRKMGHRLPAIPKYASPASAARAIRAMGGVTLEEVLDGILPRIAPAAMLPGDIGLVRAAEGAPAWRIGTAVIAVGRKFVGWHADHPTLAVIDPLVREPYDAAWRA